MVVPHIIGNTKTRQEVVLKHQISEDITCGAETKRCIQTLPRFCPTSFRVLLFYSLLCMVWEVFLSFDWEKKVCKKVRWKKDRQRQKSQGVNRKCKKRKNIFYHISAIAPVLRSGSFCRQTWKFSLACADYSLLFLSAVDTSWLADSGRRLNGGLKINSLWKFKVKTRAGKKVPFWVAIFKNYISVLHVLPIICTCSGIPDQVIKGKATVGL